MLSHLALHFTKCNRSSHHFDNDHLNSYNAAETVAIAVYKPSLSYHMSVNGEPPCCFSSAITWLREIYGFLLLFTTLSTDLFGAFYSAFRIFATLYQYVFMVALLSLLPPIQWATISQAIVKSWQTHLTALRGVVH